MPVQLLIAFSDIYVQTYVAHSPRHHNVVLENWVTVKVTLVSARLSAKLAGPQPIAITD